MPLEKLLTQIDGVEDVYSTSMKEAAQIIRENLNRNNTASSELTDLFVIQVISVHGGQSGAIIYIPMLLQDALSGAKTRAGRNMGIASGSGFWSALPNSLFFPS